MFEGVSLPPVAGEFTITVGQDVRIDLASPGSGGTIASYEVAPLSLAVERRAP